jgi:putative aldouronate transport system substrate-binding protein
VNTMAKTRLLPLIAWALVLSLLFAGCSATATPPASQAPGQSAVPTEEVSMAPSAAPTTTPAQIDTSEQVHLIFYIVGDAQPDEAGFEEALNQLLLRDINATVEFKCLSWGDVFDKYPLIMASGEVFDGCYAPNWLDFYGNVQKGAFMDITDMLPVCCPDIMTMADQSVWKTVTYKGRIYGIPKDGKGSFINDGIIYREDLRKKYNIPEFKTIDDMEAYMLAIKQNEPGMKPCSLDNVNDNYFFINGLFEKSGLEWYDYSGLVYQREDPKARMTLECTAPEFKQMVELMAKWQKLGFWNASDMANETYTNEVEQSEFGQGKSAIWGVTAEHLYNSLDWLKTNHPDWEAGFYYGPSPSGHMDRVDPSEDCAAVSTTSENPERTLMAFNRFLTQREYKVMLGYGTEGKTYVLGSEGVPQYPEGITDENATFLFGVNSFFWAAYGWPLFPEKRNGASDILDHIKSISDNPTLLGFTFDKSGLQSEVAAVNDVLMQYQRPLIWGFPAKSVEEDIAALKAQLEAAGIEKVRVEMQKQIDQFLAGGAK